MNTNGTKTENPAARKKRVSVYLSAGEFADLRARAGGMRLAGYLRRAGLGQRLPAALPAETVATIREVRGVATNINQLARRANAAGQVHADLFDEAAVQIEHFLSVLRAPATDEEAATQ